AISVDGRAATPSPAAVAAAGAAATAGHAADLVDSHVVHGDRVTPGLSSPETVGNLYVNENRLDAFFAAALSRTQTWAPMAPAAASAITVTLDGRPIAVGTDGTFRFALQRRSGHHTLLATDGAGNKTGMRIAT